jgi:hypothetical protein
MPIADCAIELERRMPAGRMAGFEGVLICASARLDFSWASDGLSCRAGSSGASRGDNLLFFFENNVLDADRRELRCAGKLQAIEPQVFDLLRPRGQQG